MSKKLSGAGLAALVLLASTAVASAQIVFAPYGWGYGYGYPYTYGYTYAPGYYSPGFYYGYTPGWSWQGVAGDSGW